MARDPGIPSRTENVLGVTAGLLVLVVLGMLMSHPTLTGSGGDTKIACSSVLDAGLPVGRADSDDDKVTDGDSFGESAQRDAHLSCIDHRVMRLAFSTLLVVVVAVLLTWLIGVRARRLDTRLDGRRRT